MRICHITLKHHVYSDSRIMERMAKSSSLDSDVCILTFGEDSSSLGRLEVMSVGSQKKNTLINFYRLLKKSLLMNADVYHIHEIPLMIIGVFLKIIGKKVIMDFHEDFEAELYDKPYLNKLSASIIKCFYIPFKVLATKIFDHIILAEKSYIDKFKHVSNKTTIIRNYPITSKFNFRQERVNKDLSIVYTGIISADRGIKNIIEALNEYNENSSNQITLDLIGRINDPMLEKYVNDESKRSEGRISWLGQKKYSEILENLTNYDVGFSALHDRENYRNSLPTKILEYGSAGLYSIVSDLPISHDYIIDGFNGSIVPPNNSSAVYKCLHSLPSVLDSIKREELRSHIIENFQWSNEFKKLEKVYKEVKG